MKRSSEASESQGSREKQARRQEPASCFWCRKKKLKCDRSHPCSNCRARKLACSFSSGGSGSGSDAAEALRGADKSSSGSSQEIDDLNSRVRKLEALLATKTSTELPDSTPSNFPQVLSKTQNETSTDVELEKTVIWLETDAFEHEPSPSGDNFATRKIAEGFGSFIFALTRPRIAPSLNMHVVAILPPRRQGEALLEFFFEEILWIYHIIHVPTVRKHLDTLYTSIENNRQPDYGPLALISTIFSLSAYFSSKSSGLFFRHTEAMSHFHKWTLLYGTYPLLPVAPRDTTADFQSISAQDALSAANCLANPTIETLQSLIFISQLLMPNLGAIATLRTLSATVTHTARALGLHQTDSDANKKRRENTQVDWVGLEVKRRIWWHICSTDWILSFMSGSQCGTYAISPKQMTVEYPSNCNDSAIDSRGDYAISLDQPTEMTYFIYRCKGSTVFREIVDAAWDCGCAGVEELPFELVLEFDKRLNLLVDEVNKKYEKLISAFPAYFDPSIRSQGRSNQKLVLLARQRLMAHFGVHTRFSRLHRPFLVRGAQDPQFAYSRMVCLRSARKVIEIGKNMMASNDRIDSIKIWTVNHHVFVSLAILVMDYCFNREEPRAKERKEEILECFRLLEEGEQQRESTIATRGLRKLKNILRDGAKPQRVPERETPQNPSQSRSSLSGVPNFFATISNMSPNDQNMFSSSTTFSQPQPLSQYQWTDFDYSSLDNINFDVDLDASQFDVLFQNIEGTKMF